MNFLCENEFLLLMVHCEGRAIGFENQHILDVSERTRLREVGKELRIRTLEAQLVEKDSKIRELQIALSEKNGRVDALEKRIKELEEAEQRHTQYEKGSTTQ